MAHQLRITVLKAILNVISYRQDLCHLRLPSLAATCAEIRQISTGEAAISWTGRRRFSLYITDANVKKIQFSAKCTLCTECAIKSRNPQLRHKLLSFQ
jgi:hypothetical protein